MAKLNIAKIFHNEHVYELEYGGWLNHRYGEASNALTEVYSNDIHLNNTTIGKYKAAKSEEYDSLKEKCGMTFMKYLRQSFKTEFDMEWDETIKGLKKPSMIVASLTYFIKRQMLQLKKELKLFT